MAITFTRTRPVTGSLLVHDCIDTHEATVADLRAALEALPPEQQEDWCAACEHKHPPPAKITASDVYGLMCPLHAWARADISAGRLREVLGEWLNGKRVWQPSEFGLTDWVTCAVMDAKRHDGPERMLDLASAVEAHRAGGEKPADVGPHDVTMTCPHCGPAPHRYGPSPDAGPYWRCSECGEPATTSAVCHATSVQDCDHCEDTECGDNTSARKASLPDIQRTYTPPDNDTAERIADDVTSTEPPAIPAWVVRRRIEALVDAPLRVAQRETDAYRKHFRAVASAIGAHITEAWGPEPVMPIDDMLTVVEHKLFEDRQERDQLREQRDAAQNALREARDQAATWEGAAKRLEDERDAALSGEQEAIARAESAELGCEIAYRREPTANEGEAYALDHGEGTIVESYVPMGNWHGHRCTCGKWVWGGGTVCQGCVDAQAVRTAVAARDKARLALEEISELVGPGGDDTPFGRVESMLLVLTSERVEAYRAGGEPEAKPTLCLADCPAHPGARCSLRKGHECQHENGTFRWEVFGTVDPSLPDIQRNYTEVNERDRQEARAELARMRPVVQQACIAYDAGGLLDYSGPGVHTLRRAVEAYRAGGEHGNSGR